MKKYTTDPKPIILSALSKLHDLVKPTYGPAGKGTLLDKGFEQSIVDDGFAIIEEFELSNELEQAVIKFVRDVSRQTNKLAGDGTTTSFLLMYAVLQEAFKQSAHALTKSDDTAIAEELKLAVVEAIKQLQKNAKKIKTVEELERIALNSYSNPVIAKLIAAMVHSIGVDGTITIEDSETMQTTTEVVTGLTLDRGHISPYMAGSNGGANELKNPLILITDEAIANIDSIISILDPELKAGRKDFLIIADDVLGSALNTLVINRLNGNANVVCIKAPGYGERRADFLEDIAVVVGATVLTHKKGRPLSSVTREDLGTAKTVTVSQDDTVIVGAAGSKASLDARIAQIRPLTLSGAEFDKKNAKSRIAALTGGIAVINVGAPTESEQKAIKMKVEDAVHATQLAFKEGVVLGGGEALAKLKTNSPLLNAALQYPRQVLVENGRLTKGAEDALGVVKAALESAVSVAATLITCAGIITEEREAKTKE